MTNDVIPEDIKQFILQNIDSIAQWEALLLLRVNPEIEWNAEAIAKRLYISEAEASSLLAQLYAQGFLMTAIGLSSPLYRYQPKVHELEIMVSRVANLYARYLVPITHLIHSKPKKRIQEFANAFKLRKD